MGALRSRGLKVQPYKTGPDYIDTGYHTCVTGEKSRNLDTWMLSSDTIIELFSRSMAGKDIGVIEGVMGLFDGHSSTGESGSTAELAKLLGAPVILVVDSSKGARSLAAMVAGYNTFDPRLTISGVILNGIGSDWHYTLCKEAIEHYTGVPVLGYLPRESALSLPERHLGLLPAVENPANSAFFQRLIAQCNATFDISRIIQVAADVRLPQAKRIIFLEKQIEPVVRIAVADDEAFNFYYQDSIDLLQSWGAEIVFFSPLKDAALPEDIHGLYLGGGFPEMFAAELANNNSIKHEIDRLIRQGIPAYAECGGLMYLGESIRDFQGKEFRMTGSLPLSSRIDSPRLNLGYRTVQALNDGPLLKKGEVVRGHEFHWSVLEHGENEPNAYSITDQAGRKEGFQVNRLLASYIHLHFCSYPPMAQRFIGSCLKYKNERNSKLSSSR